MASRRDLAITFRLDTFSVWGITLLTAVVHLLVAGRYDFMRNELYFLDCGHHPSFGYADQPPLVPLIAAATQLFGENVWLLRLPAVLTAAALVPLTAALARIVGGNQRAFVMAAIAAAASPGLTAVTNTLTTATLEPIAWTGLSYCVTRAVLRGERHWMLWAGLVAGVAMEAKYGIALWVIALVVGLLVTPARSVLLWRETWLGTGLAAVLAAPSLIWQAVQGWPFIEIILNHTDSNLNGNPLQFEIGQVIAINVVLAPLWIAGIIGPFRMSRRAPARFLSTTFVVATALAIVTHGKNYYIFAAYPTMFAVGAAVCSDLLAWVSALWLTVAVANSLLALPVVLPVLSPPHLFALLERSHLRPAPEERAAIGAPLTQVFSEEMGWRELETRISAVYHGLPPEDRARAVILATNYGEAAAINVLGRKDGLPTAISGDNQYYLWGPRGNDGKIVIRVNEYSSAWRSLCDSVETVDHFGVPLAMPFERDRPILLCRNVHGGLLQAWPDFKRFGT